MLASEMALSLPIVLTLAALAVCLCHAQNQTTWVMTTFITEKYESSSTIKYASTPVTPVQRSTKLEIITGYTSEAPTTKDRTVTTWLTEQMTLPLSTYTSVSYTTLSKPLVITSNGTSSVVSWVSPARATVTFTPTACADSLLPANGTRLANSTMTNKAVTQYTGTYSPFSGQVTTTPASWPSAVTTYVNLTVSSRVITQIGSTVTVTSTVTGHNWLSTTTLLTNKTSTVIPFRYNSTSYLTTVTVTSSDWHLAYATAAAPTAPTACAATPTVTRAARCAPTNLISERHGHGAAIQWLPREWAVPLEFFPPALIGITDMDASACCQLCLDNPGCAASEWTVEWEGACRLYYYIPGGDTCGGNATLEYYGDVNAFPRQASFLQVGCGRLRYSGLKDPFCPTCEVNE